MKHYLIFAILTLVSICSMGKVLKVPTEYSTISQAIEAAIDRDTILVDPGSYFENLNFLGKSIVLASQYVYSKDLRDIENTIIDGSAAVNPDSASCLIFCSGETRVATVEGFTITDGSGTSWVDPQFPTYTWHSGGGVFIFGSSPTIKNNIIIGNHCDDDTDLDGASGGGILTYKGNPLILNNKIQYNTARYGGGIVIDYSAAEITNNLITNNKAKNIYGGGAFWCIGNASTPAILENNTIVNNETSLLGGAFYIWSTQLLARNNIIWGNTQGSGGPVYLRDGGSLDISYSIIEGGFEGVENIDLDPAFSDPTLELSSESPGIDAGNPAAQYFDLEDPQNPGMAQRPSQGTITNDMGAFGGQYCLLLSYETSGKAGQLSFMPIQLKCFPNPFSHQTTIQFKLEEFSYFELSVINITGQTVKSFGQGLLRPGNQEIIWNGSNSTGQKLPAGIYYAILQLNHDQVLASKVIITSN